jgi:hypothetical protein
MGLSMSNLKKEITLLALVEEGKETKIGVKIKS